MKKKHPGNSSQETGTCTPYHAWLEARDAQCSSLASRKTLAKPPSPTTARKQKKKLEYFAGKTCATYAEAVATMNRLKKKGYKKFDIHRYSNDEFWEEWEVLAEMD